jgi:hypothetical protein
MLRRASVVGIAGVLFLGCGAGSTEHSTAMTPSALTCGSEPHANGDGTVTAAGCGWEQQYANILAHGSALPAGEAVVTGGVTAASAIQSCGDWILGADPSGVVVFVNRSTGEVRSHGSVHAGYATSSLPSWLAGPISVR